MEGKKNYLVIYRDGKINQSHCVLPRELKSDHLNARKIETGSVSETHVLGLLTRYTQTGSGTVSRKKDKSVSGMELISNRLNQPHFG